jgi:hypothetical protein
MVGYQELQMASQQPLSESHPCNGECKHLVTTCISHKQQTTLDVYLEMHRLWRASFGLCDCRADAWLNQPQGAVATYPVGVHQNRNLVWQRNIRKPFLECQLAFHDCGLIYRTGVNKDEAPPRVGGNPEGLLLLPKHSVLRGH